MGLNQSPAFASCFSSQSPELPQMPSLPGDSSLGGSLRGLDSWGEGRCPLASLGPAQGKTIVHSAVSVEHLRCVSFRVADTDPILGTCTEGHQPKAEQAQVRRSLASAEGVTQERPQKGRASPSGFPGPGLCSVKVLVLMKSQSPTVALS